MWRALSSLRSLDTIFSWSLRFPNQWQMKKGKRSRWNQSVIPRMWLSPLRAEASKKTKKQKPLIRNVRSCQSVSQSILTSDSFVCFYLGQTPREACVSASASALKIPPHCLDRGFKYHPHANKSTKRCYAQWEFSSFDTENMRVTCSKERSKSFDCVAFAFCLDVVICGPKLSHLHPS